MSFKEFVEVSSKAVSPFLVTFITTIYNLVCCYEVAIGELTVRDYLLIVGPTNALLVGHWLGTQRRDH